MNHSELEYSHFNTDSTEYHKKHSNFNKLFNCKLSFMEIIGLLIFLMLLFSNILMLLFMLKLNAGLSVVTNVVNQMLDSLSIKITNEIKNYLAQNVPHVVNYLDNFSLHVTTTL